MNTCFSIARKTGIISSMCIPHYAMKMEICRQSIAVILFPPAVWAFILQMLRARYGLIIYLHIRLRGGLYG